MFKHKYIRLFDTQEQYQQSLENREIEEAAVIAITDSRENTPDEYQFSHRTTNSDNEILGQYNNVDPVDYFGGLEVIWGYWGWRWYDIQFDGQTLHGGQFDPIRTTSMYPDIQDGYRLEHINNLCSKITQSNFTVGYFDASNIISADNAFSYKVSRIYTYQYPKLKSANEMFYELTKKLTGGNDLYFPELENMETLQQDAYNPENAPILHFGKVNNLNLGKLNKYNDPYDINDYVKGLENCYDYSTFSPERGIIFNPTYTGDELIKLPVFRRFSKVILSKPCTRTGNSIFVGGYYASEYPLSFWVDLQLSIQSIDQWLIGSTKYVFDGYKIDIDPPIKSKRRYSESIYNSCLFNSGPFEFDFSRVEGDSDDVSEFHECKLDNNTTTYVSVKNLFNQGYTQIHLGNLKYDLNLSPGDVINLGGRTQIEGDVNDIDGVTINSVDDFLLYKATIKNSTLNFKFTGKNSDTYDIDRDIHLKQLIDSNLNIEFNTPTNKDYCYSTLYLQQTDASSITITLDTDNIKSDNLWMFVISNSGCTKTPYVYGKCSSYGSNLLSNYRNTVEEVNFENVTGYLHGGGEPIDMSDSVNLRKLGLGPSWGSLDVSHSKLLDPQSLYDSIIRRNKERMGELKLHRIVWEQYTQEQKNYIISQFNTVNIVEDEQEDNQQES